MQIWGDDNAKKIWQNLSSHYMSDVESEDEDENGNRGPRVTYRRPAWRSELVNAIIDQLNNHLATKKTLTAAVEYGEPSERDQPAPSDPNHESDGNEDYEEDMDDRDQQ